MVRDILTSPVSTMASETAFSAGNWQMDKRRISLSPDILECQIYLNISDDTKYRIQHNVIEESFTLEPFKTID